MPVKIPAFAGMTSKIVSTTVSRMTPVRSALYVPADNDRAMAKAASLAADALIFDLEDGIAQSTKDTARTTLTAYFQSQKPAQHCVVRINHHSTSYFADDIAMVAALPIDGLMLSKVASAEDIDIALKALAAHDRADMPLWCNIETPAGYVHIQAIAAHAAVVALVAGTNDLANDLRMVRTPCRSGLMHCLQSLVLAGRAYGKQVLDGTFVDLNDDAGLLTEAQQGRMFGFDGKTLIHPKQIEAVNTIFSPSAAELSHAQRTIEAYEAALTEGKGVTLLDGTLIEKLHYDRAKQVLKAGKN